MADPRAIPVIPSPQAQRALGTTDGVWHDLKASGLISPKPIGVNRQGITFEEFQRAGEHLGLWAPSAPGRP